MKIKDDSIHIGTSGWNYKHWKENFYPKELSSQDRLKFYTKLFCTVEINNSFYQLPETSTFQLWRDTVPDDFLFAVKASRYITHMKKLNEPHEALNRFLKRVAVLENKLGPILFQLPPRWKYNSARLKKFLKILPADFRFTFEFRDSSWWNDEVIDILIDYKAAFCIFELVGQLTPRNVTSDFIYIRLHGPEEAYKGQYDSERLSNWAAKFTVWREQDKEIFCYFDNDEKGYAVWDALKLQEMIKK